MLRRSRVRTKGNAMPLESIERVIETDLAAVQWQARVDLAAAHRLAVMHGFHEGISIT